MTDEEEDLLEVVQIRSQIGLDEAVTFVAFLFLFCFLAVICVTFRCREILCRSGGLNKVLREVKKVEIC